MMLFLLLLLLLLYWYLASTQSLLFCCCVCDSMGPIFDRLLLLLLHTANSMAATAVG